MRKIGRLWWRFRKSSHNVQYFTRFFPSKICPRVRQPTNFRDGEFFRAGKNLGEERILLGKIAKRSFRTALILVKFVSSYEVLETCVRRVIFSGSSFNPANKVSNQEDTLRGTFRRSRIV